MRERTKEKRQEESILGGRRQKEGLDAHHPPPEGPRRAPLCVPAEARIGAVGEEAGTETGADTEEYLKERQRRG